MITTRSFDLFSRPLHGLRLGLGRFPAMNRWAIFNRPLRADSVEPTFWAKPAFAEIASRALSRPSVVRPLTYDLRDAWGRAVSLGSRLIVCWSRLGGISAPPLLGLPAVDAYAQ